MTFISIIIPTYRDNERLGKCLDAIAEQVNHESQVEVIVANNDPESEMPDFGKFPISLTVVNESIAGSYAARNKGIEVAKGNFLLFTDSDCIPSKNWISKAQEIANDPPSDIIAGKVEVFSRTGSSYGKFDQAFAFPNEDYVQKEGFGVTANLLVSRKVIEITGGFKTGLLTGGDREFCHNASTHGFTLTYDKDMSVFHPARETWEEMSVKAKRFGGKIPQDSSKALVFLKLIGKFRIRTSDFSTVHRADISLIDRVKFLGIIARLRWVEAAESMRVFFGKAPGRL